MCPIFFKAVLAHPHSIFDNKRLRRFLIVNFFTIILLKSWVFLFRYNSSISITVHYYCTLSPFLSHKRNKIKTNQVRNAVYTDKTSVHFT